MPKFPHGSVDHLSPSTSSSNHLARHVYTVSELAKDIRRVLEKSFQQVWVEGEISNFRISSAGHSYFTLKDASCGLSAVVFGLTYKEIPFQLKDGLQVVCAGSIDAYGPRSQYQIIVERIEPKGIGGLQLALEQLKQKLEKKGLFQASHKKPIPYLPKRIGIVTSAQGAAIRDIIQVLERRFRDISIVLLPVRVQGEGAHMEIASAIRDFNNFNKQVPMHERVDVLIVGRGGGNIEDLWEFNSELLAHTIYDSRIPIISAVGHERDWTIADLVADIRAPTPSAAAELVIPRKEEVRQKLSNLAESLQRYSEDTLLQRQQTTDDLFYRLGLSMQHNLELTASRFQAITKKLPLLNPMVLFQRYAIELLEVTKQIHLHAKHILTVRSAQLHKSLEKLQALSPLQILSRGYSITFKTPSQEIIKHIRQVKHGDLIKTKLHAGEIISKVMEAKDG